MGGKGKVNATTSGNPYDEEFYKKRFRDENDREFMRYVKEVEEIIKNEGWSLGSRFNKNWCCFKHGFFNAFGIEWCGRKNLAFLFKLDKYGIRKIKAKGTSFSKDPNKIKIFINPKRTKTKDYYPLFKWHTKN